MTTSTEARPRRERAAQRVLAALEAGYEDAQRQFFLRTRDLSESGAFLCTDDPPELGAQAQIRLELPGCPAILRLRGTVIRRDPAEGSETPGFALQFAHDPNEPALRELQAYVQRVLGEGGSSKRAVENVP